MKIMIKYKLETIILTNLTKEIEAYNNELDEAIKKK
jgi:hypothetical protein